MIVHRRPSTSCRGPNECRSRDDTRRTQMRRCWRWLP
jgi:hypothetical protein